MERQEEYSEKSPFETEKTTHATNMGGRLTNDFNTIIIPNNDQTVKKDSISSVDSLSALTASKINDITSADELLNPYIAEQISLIKEIGDRVALFEAAMKKGEELGCRAEIVELLNAKYADSKKRKPNDFSDAGNAELYAAINRGRLIYTDGSGWLSWDGRRWMDGEHKATAYASLLTREMLEEAAQTYAQATGKGTL